MQLANDKTLVIRCVGPTNPTYHLNEILVYARILFSPIADEISREIAFASAVFPSWFSVTDQNKCLD
jgi:hypothetical protein